MLERCSRVNMEFPKSVFIGQHSFRRFHPLIRRSNNHLQIIRYLWKQL